VNVEIGFAIPFLGIHAENGIFVAVLNELFDSNNAQFM
jgi:hypothetical protein